MQTIKNVVNFVSFYLVWGVTGWAAGQGIGYIGPLLSVLAIAVSLFFFSKKAKLELILIGGTAAVGSCLTWSFSLLDVMVFAGGPVHFVPLWITGLWAFLAATVDHSLSWLQGRPILTAVLCAGCCPLCYLSMERLGAIQVNAPVWQSLIIPSVGWGLFMPLVFYAWEKIDSRG